MLGWLIDTCNYTKRLAMKTLRDVNFFKELTEDELALLEEVKEIHHFQKGALFIKEGVVEETFYVIIEGDVLVQKKSGNKNHVITELHAGDCIGEMVLLDETERSATGVCKTDCILFAFNAKNIKSDARFQTALDKIFKKITYETVARLKNTNVVAADALKEKLVMGAFFIRTLITLSIYTLSLNVIQGLISYFSSSTAITTILLLIVTMVMFSIIRASGYPFSYYGVNTNHAKKNIIEAILYTLPILLLITLAKLIFIKIIPAYHQLSLLDFTATMTKNGVGTVPKYFFYMCMYALFCPVQEFIFRGCIQTSLTQLTCATSGWGLFKVIIVSNCIFASVHSHLSISYALGVFLPGLFWGWMYARQKSLVGVSISHILIGVWFAFILKVQLML